MVKNWKVYSALGSGALLVFLFLCWFHLFTIKGNQVGVLESYFAGVSPNPLQSRTYVVWPWQHVTRYPTSVQVFVMNDRKDDDAEDHGRSLDSYLVQSQDSQDMHLSLQVQWRIDPAKVVNLHKEVGSEHIEEKALRPIMLSVVKNEATMMQAIEAYSGEGLVRLQQSIFKDLNNPEGELREHGIIVDNFVIEHIRLDESYTSEIKSRQVAIQKEKRAIQEEKAAQADALKAKAVAQADLNKAVVEAERDKQVIVLKAEAENEKMILAAEADAKKQVLAATAEKEASELKASALLALGKANAESEKLKFSAYSADGADTYAKIEVAKAMGVSLSGIKGYLPESMSVNLLGENFAKAIESLVGPKK